MIPEKRNPVKPPATALYGSARLVMLMLPNDAKRFAKTDNEFRLAVNLPAPDHPSEHSQHCPNNRSIEDASPGQFTPGNCQADGDYGWGKQNTPRRT